MYAEGYDLGEFLNGFEEHYRNLLVIKTLDNFDQVNVPEHYQDQYRAEAKLSEVNNLLLYIQQVDDMQNAIKWASHPNLKFELGVLKMASMPSSVKIESLLEKLDLIKKKTKPVKRQTLSTRDESQEEPEPVQISGPPPLPILSLSSMQETWPELTAQFRDTKVNLANALEFGEVKSLEDSTLIIEFANADVFHSTLLTRNKRKVEEEIFKRYSSPIHLEIVNVEKPGKSNGSGATKMTRNETAKELEKDPVLNKLIDELGLEIT